MLTFGLRTSTTIAVISFLIGCTPTINSKLEEYGFSELQPPSNLVPPGTLVTVTKNNPFVIGIICPQQNSLGGDILRQIRSSDSSTSETAKELTGKFNIDAAYLDKIKANIHVNNVDSVDMVLRNVKIYEIPDDAVVEGLGNRTKSCKTALAFRIAKGEKVSMIKSVVAADVTYKVNFKDEVNASLKAEITKKIAAEIAGSSSSSGTDSIVGNGLFWGIREDIELGLLTENSLPSTGSGIRSSLVPKGAKISNIIASDHLE